MTRLATSARAAVGVLTLGTLAMSAASARPAAASASRGVASESSASVTVTPIKHLVVVYQENVSFDHYFGTYPNAANPSNEPQFHAASTTPSVNGLTGALLTQNPNGENPSRLDRSMPLVCDQNHDYTPEQWPSITA